MEKIKDFLMSLGVGKNEAEVYAALAQHGTSTVLEISRRTNLHRSNIYDSLNELVRKGLVFKENDSKTQKFTAREPEAFADYLKQKEIELQELIKDFRTKVNLRQDTARMKMTKGMFAVKEALFNFLGKGKPILVYGIPKDAFERIGPVLKEFHKERIKKKILMKQIYNSNAEERVKFLNRLSYTEARMLPSKYDSTATTNVCGDEVFIVFWENEPTVIHINGDNISQPYQNYFDILWSRAKEVK